MEGMVKDFEIVFPDKTGVMILPGVCLFPGGLLPLRIFEPRYRQMLADSLNDLRMFSIAHSEDDLENEWGRIGTVGVVRACVKNSDDTSNLILQGLARVEFSRCSLEPYPHADIQVLRDPDVSSKEIKKLRDSVQKHLLEEPVLQNRLPQGFAEHLTTVSSPAAFADLVASTALMDPMARRLILEELDVMIRLEILLGSLEEELAGDETEEV
jgi:Lon protease-like protein